MTEITIDRNDSGIYRFFVNGIYIAHVDRCKADEWMARYPHVTGQKRGKYTTWTYHNP